MTNTDVVCKLIGSITPSGHHYVDEERFVNLKNMITLIDQLIIMVSTVADINEDKQEDSMKIIGQEARKAMNFWSLYTSNK
jgi:hypothetical protein